MKEYLFLLGTNTDLSLAELKGRATVKESDEKESLAICTDLKFINPRNLYKSEEQLFLDGLGGVIRYGEIVGRYDDWDELADAILDLVPEEKQSTKFKFGVSTFGRSAKDVRDEIFAEIRDRRPLVRITNPPQDNLSSARLFDERVLQKGVEVLVWFKDKEYILAKTVATQNIRNYTIRDRKKGFRDTHMGMMPPKLAQIMINLGTLNAPKGTVVVDPFCGSGTTNVESVLLGFPSIGSDLDGERVQQSQNNYTEMGGRFRFEPDSSTFFESDATKFPINKLKGNTVVITEGYLGQNFRDRPKSEEVQASVKTVTMIWENFFRHWSRSPVNMFVICLPCWNNGKGGYSIFEQIKRSAEKHGFAVDPILSAEYPTYLYSRPDANVGREIVRFVRK